MEVDASIERMTIFLNGKPEPFERMTICFQQIPRAVLDLAHILVTRAHTYRALHPILFPCFNTWVSLWKPG